MKLYVPARVAVQVSPLQLIPEAPLASVIDTEPETVAVEVDTVGFFRVTLTQAPEFPVPVPVASELYTVGENLTYRQISILPPGAIFSELPEVSVLVVELSGLTVTVTFPTSCSPLTPKDNSVPFAGLPLNELPVTHFVFAVAIVVSESRLIVCLKVIEMELVAFEANSTSGILAVVVSESEEAESEDVPLSTVEVEVKLVEVLT